MMRKSKSTKEEGQKTERKAQGKPWKTRKGKKNMRRTPSRNQESCFKRHALVVVAHANLRQPQAVTQSIAANLKKHSDAKRKRGRGRSNSTQSQAAARSNQEFINVTGNHLLGKRGGRAAEYGAT